MAVRAFFALVGAVVLTVIGYNGLGPGSSLRTARRLQEASPSEAADGPGYTKTVGLCRGGQTWSHGALWDCSPGSLDAAGCEAACNANPDCGAYDRPDQVGAQECCLFRAGNTGQGSAGRACFLKPDTSNASESTSATITTTTTTSNASESTSATITTTTTTTTITTNTTTTTATVPAADGPGYTKTVGLCRGGQTWSHGALWDCSPGSLDAAGCEAACNANPDCGAYDRPDQVGAQECCLFRAGNTGQGSAGRACFLKPDTSNASESANSTEPCLCVFDIDRTLTGRQNDVTTCPRNKVMSGVHDGAYGSGDLTLSALAAEGIENTFCGQCYLGVCSAGDAGGENSKERDVLLDDVLNTPLYDALRAKIPSASWWSWSNNIVSPLVLGSPNKRKQHSVESIRIWYQHHGIDIPSGNVYFFGDRRENIPPFGHLGLNAKEISCASRDTHLYGGSRMVGYCGATPEEIVAEKGVHNC